MPKHWQAHPSVAVYGPAYAQGLAQAYYDTDQHLDQVYQTYAARLALPDQLALSQEQTVWLNERNMLCAADGTTNYRCGLRLTNARITVLAERLSSVLNAPPPDEAEMADTAPPADNPVQPAATAAAAAGAQLAAAQNVPLPVISPAALRLVMSERSPPQPAPAPPLAVQPAVVQPVAPAPAPTPAPAPAPAAPAAMRAVQQPAPVAAMRAATYTVPATAMPWVWKAGGINNAFEFGYPDGTSPTIVPLQTLGTAPGSVVSIKYVAGQIALGPGAPQTDASGYAGMNHGNKGIVGLLPSAFMPASAVNLGALVGAFTDTNGVIIGAPFPVGNGEVVKKIPAGATQLQLGVNDDIFGGEDAKTANSGSFTVQVSAAPNS